MKNFKKKLFYIAQVAWFAGLMSAFFAVNSFAYLEPAATTGIVTAVSGLIIAGSAVFIIMWRRAKEKVSAALGIDANRNKEVEAEIVDLGDDTQNK